LLKKTLAALLMVALVFVSMPTMTQQTIASPSVSNSQTLNLPLFILNNYSGSSGNVYITETGDLFLPRRGQVYDTDVRSVHVASPHGRESIIYLRNDGTLWGWGSNRNGQLGDNTGVDRSTPIKIMDDVATFGLEGSRVWVIKTDLTYWVWGAMGSNNSVIDYEPVHIANDIVRYFGSYDFPGAISLNLVQTSAGELLYAHTFLQPYGGINYLPDVPVRDVKTAAYNSDFYLLWIDADFNLWERSIRNIRATQYVDNKIAENVAELSLINNRSGGDTVFYITTDGALYGWGNNANGQLGDGTRISHANPVKIADGVGTPSNETPTTSNTGDLPIAPRELIPVDLNSRFYNEYRTGFTAANGTVYKFQCVAYAKGRTHELLGITFDRAWGIGKDVAKNLKDLDGEVIVGYSGTYQIVYYGAETVIAPSVVSFNSILPDGHVVFVEDVWIDNGVIYVKYSEANANGKSEGGGDDGLFQILTLDEFREYQNGLIDGIHFERVGN